MADHAARPRSAAGPTHQAAAPPTISGLWGSLSQTAKSIFLDDPPPTPQQDIEEAPEQERPHGETIQGMKVVEEAEAAMQKGLDSITFGLAKMGDTFGTALEEGFTLVAKTTSDFMAPEPKNAAPKAWTEGSAATSVDSPSTIQLKASRDVAALMAARAKQSERQVASLKAELEFSSTRLAQLEEENRQLRESLESGGRLEEDPLIRKQLKVVLAEKSRLSLENERLSRENDSLEGLLEFAQKSRQEWEGERASTPTGDRGVFTPTAPEGVTAVAQKAVGEHVVKEGKDGAGKQERANTTAVEEEG